MAKFEYTKEHIKSQKLALLLGAITAGVADIFVVVLLMIAGLWGYVALPIALAVADIAFLVVALFTNFRFRYSMTYVITYLAIFIGCVIGHFLVIRGGAETAMTAIALIIWVAVHILNFIVIMLGAKGALTRQKSHHFVTALVVILFIASVGVYVGFGSAEGYFGQGSLTARPIVYMYDEKTDSYTATGVLDGSGKFAVIPEKFDGKPVSAIDASIFTAARLDRLEIQTAANVSLLNLNAVSGITVQEISAPRETLTTIQRELYTAYRDEGKNAELLSLAARTAPSDLQEGEIYITFTYTDTALDCIGDTFLPSWIGHKGDRFTLSELASNIDYIQNTSNTDEALLHELYTSNKQGSGYILLPIMLDAKTPLNGTMIQKSHKNVVVDFEKIYRVEIKEDNDSLYTMPHTFTSIFANGEDIGYRYVTPSTIASLLPSAEKREGFSISWEYGYGNGFILPEATTSAEALLSALDGRDESKFTVTPTWTMNAPVIQSLSTNSLSGAFTYGDRVDFDINATSPAQGTLLTYNWYFGDTFLTTTENYEIPVILMNQGGEYTVEVIASSTTVTSLTSKTSRSTTISVSKKEIDISWLGIEDTSYEREYDSFAHSIAISYNENDLVTPVGASRDLFTYEFSQNTVKNAKSYEITVTLTGDTDTKYTLRQNDKKQTYVITQKPVSIEWSNLVELVYNAQAQKPSVTITSGICDGDSVTVSISDTYAQTGAGTYNATATLSNENYRIAESASKQFTIQKKDITILWTEKTEFIYDRSEQGPIPSTTGIEPTDLSHNVALTRINAGTNAGTYTAGVTINSNNYRIVPEGSTKEYTINPKTLSVDWSTTQLTYTAAKQYPSTTLRGVVTGDTVNLSYTIENDLGAVNVGTYTVIAESQNPNYILDTTNRHSYDITKATVHVNWSATTQTYAATSLLPSYTIVGMLGSDTYGLVGTGGLAITLSISGAQTNVCENAPIAMSYESANYIIEESTLTTTLTITKKEITLTWANNSFTYNAQAQIPTATIKSGVLGDDVVQVEVSGSETLPGTSYKATATLTNSNYAIRADQQQYAFTIAKKTLTPVWSDLEFTYNGNAHNPTVTLQGIVDADIGKVTFTITDAQTNAGTHTASIALDGMKDCYALSSTSKQFTVQKAVLTPNWSGLEYTYDKTAHTPTVTFDGVFGSDNVSASFNRSGATDAGEYTFKISGLTNGNYTVSADTERTMVIKPKTVTVTFKGDSFIYNGKVQQPTYSIDGILDGDNARATLSANGKNKGDYTAKLTIGNGNYAVEDEATLSYAYSITPALITISWGEDSFVFDNTDKFPTYTLSGIVSGESETTLLATKTYFREVGEYIAEYTVANANYTIANPKHNISITPRQVTPTIPANRTYTYNGKAQTPTFTWENINGYDYKSRIEYSAGESGVGTYIYEAYLTDANVILVGASAEYTITPKEITISWTNTTLTYNGKEQLPTATPSGIVADDSGEVFLTLLGAQTFVTPSGSTYLAQAELNSNNYTIRQGQESNTFTIVPKTVTIAWSNYNTVTYDGKDHKPTATIASAICEGDSVSIVYCGGAETEAGTYTMTIELDNGNYAIQSNQASRSFTISPKQVNVSWSNATGFVYDGTAHTLTATISLVSGETLTLDVTYKNKATGANVAAPVDAGTYVATASYTNGNYTLSGTTKEFTVAQASLNVSWTVGEYTYANFGQAPKASAKLVDGSEALLTMSYATSTGEVVDGKPINAGSYKATASYDNPNYIIKNATQSFTIQKVKLTVVWNQLEREYTGQKLEPTAVAQLISGKGIDFQYTFVKDGKATDSAIAVGTYTVTISFKNNADANNYEILNPTATFVIVAKK